MCQHKRKHTISRLQKKYKHLAAALAGVAILSGASLHGADAVVHAAPAPQQQSVSPAPSVPAGDTDMAALQTTKPNKEAPVQKKQELTITATAYAPGPHDNGKWGDKTYLGTQIRPGVIAVDPKIIPLGSRVYIQYPDGHGEYAIAEDTGGAIKGNRIDVAKWSVKEAEDFGIQQVKVTVVSTPKRQA